jgi:internalin A
MFLIERAHDATGQHTVLQSLATLTDNVREQLIAGLLTRGDNEPEHRAILHLLAAHCLDSTNNVSQAVKERVEKSMRKFVPITNLSKAKLLVNSEAGPLAARFIVQQLTQPGLLSATAIEASIHALALIGTTEALQGLGVFIQGLTANEYPLDDLVRLWRRTPNPSEFGQYVMAPVLQIDQKTELRLYDFSSLAGVQYLTMLEILDVERGTAITDLSPLTGLPHLKALRLEGCRKAHDFSMLATLTKLEVLIIHGCDASHFETNMLKHLPCLRRLELRSLIGLRDTHILHDFPTLEVLDLSNNRNLSALTSLTGLPNLRTLRLNNCAKLENIHTLTNLPQLETLELKGSRALKDFRALQSLVNLQELNLHANPTLHSLTDILPLPCLRVLDLSSCSNLVDINALAGASQLESLNLGSCERLQALCGLADIPGLSSLDLTRCSSLQSLHHLGHLPSMQTFSLSTCDELLDLQGIGGMYNLHSLRIDHCGKLHSLNGIETLGALEELHLENLETLQDINALTKPESKPHLCKLEIANCSSLTDFCAIRDMPNLQEILLSIPYTESPPELPSFQGLPKLISLKIRGQVSSIAGLGQLSQLQELELFVGSFRVSSHAFEWSVTGSSRSLEWGELSHLHQLRSLSLWGCQVDFSALAGLTNLQTLSLFSVANTDCKGLTNLPSLRDLLIQSSQLQSLEGLAGLYNLQTVMLPRCSHLKRIINLSDDLVNLKTFDVNDCSSLEDISGLANVTSLHTLNCSKCTSLRDIRPLASLHQLERLDFSKNTSLEDISPLIHLAGLKRLSLNECSKVEDITSLADLAHLEIVSLNWTEVSDISALAKLSHLRILDILAQKVKDLTPLHHLPNLHELWARSGTRGLKELRVKVKDLNII